MEAEHPLHSRRALYKATLKVAESTFHRMAAQVPPPREVPWGDRGFVYRYTERLPQQALILKLARQVSGLFAIDALLFRGLVKNKG
jgi:hypothetical protein